LLERERIVITTGYCRINHDVPAEDDPFDEDYYMNGICSGKSNYENYAWMPEKTQAMVDSVIDYLDINQNETVLDFGCARGYVVKCLRRSGIEAYGVDTSRWALENADDEVKHYLSRDIPGQKVDHVFAKDVFEHISYSVLDTTILQLLEITGKKLFAVVPLTDYDFGHYVCERDENDATHQVRWTLSTWIMFLAGLHPEFVVNGSYHIPGVKDASVPFPKSCGFLTCKRIKSNSHEIHCPHYTN
jgi:hypothetical protein